MPARTPAVVLGFLGGGDASTDSVEALLTELVDANGGKAKVILPATQTHWNDGIEAVADLAEQKGWAVEVVTDDSSAKHKPVKGYLAKAQKQTKAENVGATIQSLVTEAGGKLILFWEEDNEEVYDALVAGADAGTPVLDICEGLKEIELGPPSEGEGEAQEVAGGDENEVTAEWLAEKTDNEIEAIADGLGIDVEKLESWDDVRTAILEHYQAGGGEGGDDEQETELPTDEDVDAWDLDTLKQYATDNEIEVPARAREAGYRGAIKDFLADAREQAAALSQEESDLQLPADPEGPLALDPEFMEEIRAGFKNIEDRIAALDRGVVEALTGIRESIQGNEKDPGPSPSTGVKKAAAAVKAAPAKTAGTTKAAPVKAAAKAGGAAPRTVGRR